MSKKNTFYLIFLSVFLSTSNVLAGYPKTDTDYMLLPPFCKARASGSKSLLYRNWKKKLGPDFIHIHHYCASLHTFRKAQLMYPKNKDQKQDKAGLLFFVFDNIKYLENHAKHTFILFPHIYTTKAEAYLEAKNNNMAIDYFNKAISANKKFTKPYALLSDFYLKNKNKKKAREILQDGLKHSPNSRALNKRLKKLKK